MTDTYKIILTLDPMESEARQNLINAILQLKGIKMVESHLEVINDERPKTIAQGYWNTLLEMIRSDRSVPSTNRARISEGVAVSFADRILTVAHPEPEWAQQRFARTFDNWIVALCPGAHIMFECSRQSEPRGEPGPRDYAR